MFPECMFPDQYTGCHLSRPVHRDGIYPGQYIGCPIGRDKCILYALVGILFAEGNLNLKLQEIIEAKLA